MWKLLIFHKIARYLYVSTFGYVISQHTKEPRDLRPLKNIFFLQMFLFYKPLCVSSLQWGRVVYIPKIVKNKLVFNIIICKFVVWWCVLRSPNYTNVYIGIPTTLPPDLKCVLRWRLLRLLYWYLWPLAWVLEDFYCGINELRQAIIRVTFRLCSTGCRRFCR